MSVSECVYVLAEARLHVEENDTDDDTVREENKKEENNTEATW